MPRPLLLRCGGSGAAACAPARANGLCRLLLLPLLLCRSGGAPPSALVRQLLLGVAVMLDPMLLLLLPPPSRPITLRGSAAAALCHQPQLTEIVQCSANAAIWRGLLQDS